MQTSTTVEKFKKPSRVMLEGTNQVAVITKGKKFNKTKRGGGIKSLFRSADDSFLNTEKYIKD